LKNVVHGGQYQQIALAIFVASNQMLLCNYAHFGLGDLQPSAMNVVESG